MNSRDLPDGKVLLSLADHITMMTKEAPTKCAYQVVLDEFLESYKYHIENYATIQTGTGNSTSIEALTKDLETMLSLGAMRMTNMTGSRHSDSMRSETSALRHQGIVEYTRRWNAERSRG